MKPIKRIFGNIADFFLLLVFSLIAGCLIGGCASIGAAPAMSVSEQIDYGRGAVTGIASTCLQQLTTNTMSLPAAQKCLLLVDSANSSFDAAKVALGSNDQPKALAALAAATSILTQLQTTLQAKRE